MSEPIIIADSKKIGNAGAVTTVWDTDIGKIILSSINSTTGFI